MMKPVLVTGDGTYPITNYESMDAALSELIPILGEPTAKKGGAVIWKFSYGELPGTAYDEDPIIAKERRELIRKAEDCWRGKMEQLFDSYYDGCGGINAILAKEITFEGLKTHSFSLD